MQAYSGLPSDQSRLVYRAVPFHLLGGSFQVAAAGLFFWAVTQIPLATAGALGLTGTLMIGPLAWVLLGETMTKAGVSRNTCWFCGRLVHRL